MWVSAGKDAELELLRAEENPFVLNEAKHAFII